MDANQFLPDEAAVAGISKDIETYEAGRLAAQRQIGWRVPLFMGGWAVATVALAWLFNVFADPSEQWASAPHMFLYVIALCTGVPLWIQAIKPARRFQQSFREKLLPAIFGFIDDMRYRHGTEPGSFNRLPSAATGNFTEKSFDDVISGRFDDFPFELYETRLARKAGKSSQTLFKGVILAFGIEQPFPGTLVAVRKAGIGERLLRDMFGDGGLGEIRSGVGPIDAMYDFRTDNAEAALPLVTGRLARALQWLDEAWPEAPARIALKGQDGFLLLPTSKDFFELPTVHTSIDYTRHVQPIIAEMVSLLVTGSLVRKAGVADAVSDAQP